MTNTEGPTLTNAAMTRRRLIQGSATSALLPVSQALAASGVERSKAFCLVHGAWHGGWCWQFVADLLRAEGHRVLTPTLTGCGDRLHLATPQTNLRTHVTDVLATLHYEGITDVVLVGHSYAGLVVSQVASEATGRVISLVYLDAFLPEPGQSFAGITGLDMGSMAEDGGVAPMLSVEELGIVGPEAQAFVEDRLTRHPLGTFEQPVEFSAETLAKIRRVFIQTSDLFASEAEKAAHLGFEVQKIAGSGHDAMLTQPVQIARTLLTFADAHHHLE